MKLLTFMLTLITFVQIVEAQDNRQTGSIKEWRIPLQNGEVQMVLDHGLGDGLVLGILGPSCQACTSLEEMSHAVTRVIAEMSSIGQNPSKLVMMTTRINEVELRKKIADAAVSSEQWKSCMKVAGCGGNGLLVDFLNQARGYETFGEGLKRYGLTVHVGSAEKVEVRPAGSVRGLALPAGVRATLKIPVDASLELIVSHVH